MQKKFLRFLNDMENICRVCLSSNNLINIFPGTKFAENMMLCASVFVIENDGLPQTICKNCNDELNVCIKFREKCEKTDRTLRLHLNTKNAWGRSTSGSKEHFISELISTSSDLKANLFGAENTCSSTQSDPSTITEVLTDGTDSTKRISSDTEKETAFKQFEDDLLSAKYFSCKYCTQKFPSKQSWENHVNQKHKQSYRCEFCNRDFLTRRYLNIHRLNRHQTTPNQQTIPCSCDICGKTFKYQSNLIKHMCSHRSLKQFQCERCSKIFLSQSALMKHSLNHFMKQDKELQKTKLQCDICSKKFMTKSTLMLHRKDHSEMHGFSCSFCKITFIEKAKYLDHLKLHRKRHLPERTDDMEAPKEKKILLQCNKCGKPVDSTHKLKGHLLQHLQSDRKSFSCSKCVKKFRSLHTKNCHEKLHH